MLIWASRDQDWVREVPCPHDLEQEEEIKKRRKGEVEYGSWLMVCVQQQLEYGWLTSTILLGRETAVRVDTGHRHVLEGIGPTAPPFFALPPAVGTCASLFHHPSSFVAAWRLPSDHVSRPEGAYGMERGRSGDNRVQRLHPYFMGPIAAVQGIISKVDGGRHFGAVGRGRWDKGQKSLVHLSQPPQPDRVLPITTVQWAEQNHLHHPGECPEPVGRELAGLGGECCDLTATTGHGCAVSLDLQFLDSEEASGRPIM